MACEKVLIDYELLSRYKEYENKFHTVKNENDDLRKKINEMKKKYDESISVQKGEGVESAELQQRLMTQANGVVNAETQKIIPLDNVVDPSENFVTENGEGVGNNDGDDDDDDYVMSPWYFLGVPKNCQNK